MNYAALNTTTALERELEERVYRLDALMPDEIKLVNRPQVE